MDQSQGNKIEMIPVSQIDASNSRTRNKRQHQEIIENIEKIGLKGPITEPSGRE